MNQGVDVSDDTVGTTTMDIPASGIKELQLGQSSLDISDELTSSGAVNMTTRWGRTASMAKLSACSAIARWLRLCPRQSDWRLPTFNARSTAGASEVRY